MQNKKEPLRTWIFVWGIKLTTSKQKKTCTNMKTKHTKWQHRITSIYNSTKEQYIALASKQKPNRNQHAQTPLVCLCISHIGEQFQKPPAVTRVIAPQNPQPPTPHTPPPSVAWLQRCVISGKCFSVCKSACFWKVGVSEKMKVHSLSIAVALRTPRHIFVKWKVCLYQIVALWGVCFV